ncbi:heme-binding protein soul3 isoform X2 [Silurus meridionalis]|uniref:heme-binding protein soul3 isoform X2 n=1 Tax=Silurus meridionalis TaxID=175797 RepID=UPI001EEA5033|nr:heme-binding protein soul3 isoform X2 [Silurus meridionalis]
MDGGTCGFNGERERGRGREGEDQGSEPQHGMITLEDLETLSDDDQLSGSSFAEREMMEDEEQNRMLYFWQDAARGHRIEVPRDMAEPIQQLTTNNNGTHQRETVSFTLLSRKKKCGDLLYEKRRYDKAHWACTTVEEETYEQSIGYGFMKIMRYICQQNSLGIYLGMTIPILTVVRIEGANESLSRGVTVAYYLPLNHQARPPQPLDPDIVIEEWPDTIVYTRAFSGATNESTLTNQINTLAEILDTPELYVTNSFIVAGYTNPAAAHRVNEIWFIQRQ